MSKVDEKCRSLMLEVLSSCRSAGADHVVQPGRYPRVASFRQRLSFRSSGGRRGRRVGIEHICTRSEGFYVSSCCAKGK